jgi:hypothetical protein
MFLEILYAVGAFIISIGGGAGVVFGLCRFYGKTIADQLLEAVRAKYAGELERLKSDYRHEVDRQLHTLRDQQERGQFVHRLQFETEFKAYLDLWPHVFGVNSQARRLRPVHVWNSSTDEERQKALGEAFEKFVDSFELRKPFLAVQVYDAANSPLIFAPLALSSHDLDAGREARWGWASGSVRRRGRSGFRRRRWGAGRVTSSTTG